MKAMILAAGLGMRLRPLTDDRPKALVTIAGRTMLQIALERVRAFGVRDVIVNVHHYSETIVAYLEANDSFGMRIEVSREPFLLDTGGGLKQAAWFFLDEGARADEPFLLHNVDVISNIDLGGMVRHHQEQDALATLAVQSRESSRYLLFDEQEQLCGRRTKQDGRAQDQLARPAPTLKALAFAGIHAISPRLLVKMNEEGAFSIIDAYLRLAAQGEKIIAYHADGCYWRDLGRPESVEQAARDMESGKLTGA